MVDPLRKSFLDVARLRELSRRTAPTEREVLRILEKARALNGLSVEETAALLCVDSPEMIRALLDAAGYAKETIYGRRMVLFAPLYIGNTCSNSCLYCAFRKENTRLRRAVLTADQIRTEAEMLLREGHKRIVMLCGESSDNDLDHFLSAIRTVYATRVGKNAIRRINVEIAPLDVEGFRRLKEAKIGTYICFQETYDPDLYAAYHPSGPKADYLNRLMVMDRAMEGGIDDVGLGVLFGLGDYRFEVLALMEHALHLEETFGCGPHTVSVPRIEPAEGTPFTEHIPYAVSDDAFRKIIAVIRLAMPYTGIILSTRESEGLRNELFRYGVSQISAGSRTNPGAYADAASECSGSQFSLGDHRSLDEVIGTLIDQEFIPSFCTGCYRKGRVGRDFMDLAKPGLIQRFCMPNGLFTFQEYLEDFASPAVRTKGKKLIGRLVEAAHEEQRPKIVDNLRLIESGERDVYF